LAWASDTSAVLNPEYTKRHIQKIAQEMKAALTLVRHSVEGLLEAQSPPDEFYDGGGRPRKDFDIYAEADSSRTANSHYDDGKYHGGL
jgi:hypothetical protein